MNQGQVRWGMLCLALAFSVMACVQRAEAQEQTPPTAPAQAPEQKPAEAAKLELEKFRPLVLKIGWTKKPFYLVPKEESFVIEPIEGAALILRDENGVAVGTGITDAEGMAHWLVNRVPERVEIVLVGSTTPIFQPLPTAAEKEKVLLIGIIKK